MTNEYLGVPIDPNEILVDVVKNRLSKEIATDLLISLVDSPNDSIRIETIGIFLKLSLNSEKAFRIIENCFVSDENALVREAAAKVIFYNFTKKKNFLPLKYAVRHENSPIVIRSLIDMFESTKDDPHFIIFSEQIIKRLKKIYKIPLEEINLYLNLEVIYIEYAHEYEFKAGDTWFKIIGMLKNFLNTTELIQRLYYLKLGGKKYTPLPDHSISYLKDNFLKEKSF